MKVCFELTQAEIDKLAALAAARGKTPEQCIKDFVVTCQPSGSGWQHPAEGKSNV